jgi:Ca-activated chloride channel family protein
MGVRVFTVGMGSPEGVTLELEGFSVHTRLDEPALQQIALLTGGAYIPAEASLGLPALYDELSSSLVIRAEPTEVTAPLAGAALLLMLAGGLCSFVWFNRLV